MALVPTLQSVGGAGNGEIADLSGQGGIPEGEVYALWQFNSSSPNRTQSAYAFRRKLQDSINWEYWDNGLQDWSATEVKNTSSNSIITFPTGAWTNGNTYNWSVKTWDDLDSVSAYPSNFTVIARDKPTVTITAPLDNPLTTTSYPNVTWDRTTAPESEATHYRVKVFDSGRFSASGFDPDTSGAFWDSEEVSSDAQQRTIERPLSNGGTFRIYVKITQTGGQLSDWDYIEFLVSLSIPPPPSLSVLLDPENARVHLISGATVNLLSLHQSDLEEELGATGFTALSKTLIERTDEWANTGTHSLRVTTGKSYDSLNTEHSNYDDLNNAYTDYNELNDSL